MTIVDEYQKLVLDDVKTYAGICRPVKSSIPARIFIRKLPVNKLHPNPEDEFCDPKIGPSYPIVTNYIQEFQKGGRQNKLPFGQGLTVEKMSTGGYMLLNGHHRWLAANILGYKKVQVNVVNAISETEVIAAINSSDKRMCVSFDLDEVLLTDRHSELADHRLIFPYNFIIRRTLRKHAGNLINELRGLGFDVWVYSGSAVSREEVHRLMSLHKARVDGMVMLLKGKSSSNLQQAFRDKYELSLHIDNENLLWVNTRTREYDSIPVAGGAAWAADALAKVRGLEELKRIAEARKDA